MRKFFEFFRLQGCPVVDEHLIPLPRVKYKLPRVADEAQYRKLLSVIPRETNDPRHIRNRVIVDMLWDTGARDGEIVALDIPDLDLNRRRAVISTEKSRGRRPFREIFWTHKTNENLVRWLEKRKYLPCNDTAAVFVCAVGVKTGQRLTIKGVGEMLRHYCNRAGLPYMNAHSFRHHMGHALIKNGGSAADVANILGHASLASSTIYTMMHDRELESCHKPVAHA